MTPLRDWRRSQRSGHPASRAREEIVSTPPAPTIDEHSAPYWEALAERRILTQKCESCGRTRFPRMPSCPYCATPGGTDIEIDGKGVVYSFVRVHRALTPAFADEAPYAVATVELDAGG